MSGEQVARRQTRGPTFRFGIQYVCRFSPCLLRSADVARSFRGSRVQNVERAREKDARLKADKYNRVADQKISSNTQYNNKTALNQERTIFLRLFWILFRFYSRSCLPSLISSRYSYLPELRCVCSPNSKSTSALSNIAIRSSASANHSHRPIPCTYYMFVRIYWHSVTTTQTHITASACSPRGVYLLLDKKAILFATFEKKKAFFSSDLCD